MPPSKTTYDLTLIFKEDGSEYGFVSRLQRVKYQNLLDCINRAKLDVLSGFEAAKQGLIQHFFIVSKHELTYSLAINSACHIMQDLKRRPHSYLRCLRRDEYRRPHRTSCVSRKECFVAKYRKIGEPNMSKKPKKDSKGDETEFSRLFWAAREEHNRYRKEVSFNAAAHKAAVAFAESRQWDWAVVLLEASRVCRAGQHDAALRQLDEIQTSVPDRWQGLLHLIRGATLGAKGEQNEAIQAYRKALDDPKSDIPGNAWYNLGVALGAKGEYNEAIQAYHKALDDPKFATPGNAWFGLGVALDAKGDLDKAIWAYRKALDDTKYGTRGNTWHNLGNSLAAKGEHDEAIQAYRKALNEPKIDTPGYTWNNLGISLSNKGEHDEAIEAFRMALEDTNYDTSCYAWNNLGNALGAKGEHDEAIQAYCKALDDPKLDPPARAWTNLAQSYIAVGNQKCAEEAFEKALASPDPQGGDHARARAGLRMLKAKIKPEALSPDDRAMVGKMAASAQTEEVENGIIAAIQAAGDTQYEKYIGKPDSNRDNTLSILRGWSSAVTLLEGSERRWRGGGYFLKWRGYGIVIDPGFDFLRNFHDSNYHGREIQAVLVSHNHPDHNSDLKNIDDLRYELFKRLPGTGKPDCQPYVLLWDQDTDGATKFGFQKPQHQHEPVVMASGFPQPINLLKHSARVPIQVKPFKVNHGNDVPHAMGIVVELLDKKGKPLLRIGYTADTGYFEDLHRHLSNCDVLIAHISQPSIEELQDASKLKEVHLGYRGTARLLKETKPKLTLIGEFWAGFTDLRIPLVKGLRQLSGVQSVLPAGLGMHLSLPSLEIECTECKKPTPFGDVRIAPPPGNFGNLAYLCPKCMIG